MAHKNIRKTLITSVSLFASLGYVTTQAYACLHNFVGKVASVGFSKMEKNKATRMEMFSGEIDYTSANKKNPLKLFIAPNNSTVIPQELDSTTQENLKKIKETASSLVPMPLTRDGSKSIKPLGGFETYSIKGWEVKVKKYSLTDNADSTDAVFDNIKKTFGVKSFESADAELDFNDKLKNIIRFGYAVFVVYGMPPATANVSRDNGVSIGVKITSPVTIANYQDYFDVIVTSKIFEMWLSNGTNVAFQISDMNRKIFLKYLSDSKKIYVETNNDNTELSGIILANKNYTSREAVSADYKSDAVISLTYSGELETLKNGTNPSNSADPTTYIFYKGSPY